MEGNLKRYKNFLTGYNQCFAIIRKTSLIVQKAQKSKEDRVKIYLKNAQIESSTKDQLEFVVNYTDRQKKQQKLHFKAKD